MLPFQTVVCAIDFTSSSAHALIQAADVAERAHAALHLFHAVPLFRARLAAAPGGDVEVLFQARATAFVNETLGASDAAEVLAPVLHEVHGVAPSDGVLRCAESVGADLIVVGTGRPRGLDVALLGSVASEVVRRSPVPVLVVPGAADRPAARPDAPVLVGVDFSALTAAALRLGRTWATDYAAPLELAHVVEGTADAGPVGFLTARGRQPQSEASARATAHQALRAVAEEAGGGVAAQHVLHGRASSDLAALASERAAGVVVVGTHGRSGIERFRLGSVADWLARHAPCSVLVAPSEPPASEPPASGPGVQREAS